MKTPFFVCQSHRPSTNSFYASYASAKDEIDYATYLYTDSCSERPVSPAAFEYPPLPRLRATTPTPSDEAKSLDFAYLKLRERRFAAGGRSASAGTFMRGNVTQCGILQFWSNCLVRFIWYDLAGPILCKKIHA